MSESPEPSPSPPGGGGASIRRMLWLPAAFMPSVVGIICLSLKNPGPGLVPFLVLVNLAGSVAASLGLVAGIKNLAARAFVALFLILFFFVMNVIIVIFVGCSGTGRIAP